MFRGKDTTEEEERRIWYVAHTRAKRKVYVIVSAETESHSPFADELYHNEGGGYDVGEDELAELLEPLRPHGVTCRGGIASRVERNGLEHSVRGRSGTIRRPS